MKPNPNVLLLQHFVDALREVLDLEPLYRGRRAKTLLERFYRPMPDVGDRRGGQPWR